MRALLASLALAATPALSDTWGLVIGIDDYQFVPKLHGAVNDARDIADALTGIGAEVTLLLDAEADRETILRSWREMAAKVQPGDRFVISYAGHGSYEPEAVPGSEEDGRDENFLLAGFAPRGEAAGQRIRDDEIAELIALTPQAEVVFVADACHSGTVTRNVSPTLGYRYVTGGQLSDDPLPPPPPGTADPDGEQMALFLAAVDETEKVPEFLIDGQPRGALSYAFAKGLRGAADTDGDGDLTRAEIAGHVRRSIRDVSQGLQAPQISPGTDQSHVIFQIDPAAAPPPLAVPPFFLRFDLLPPVALAVSGGGDAPLRLATVPGIRQVEDPTGAEAVADFDRGELRSHVGDVLARFDPARPAQGLGQIVSKIRLVNALNAALPADALAVTFAEGDRTYRAGERITVRIEGRATPNITLLALPSDGSMALLYPLTGNGLSDPRSLSPADPVELMLQVAPPFGADHIVAIETFDNPADLRRLLADLEAQGAHPAQIWEELRAHLQTHRTPPRLAVFPFHTDG